MRDFLALIGACCIVCSGGWLVFLVVAEAIEHVRDRRAAKREARRAAVANERAERIWKAILAGLDAEDAAECPVAARPRETRRDG